MKLTSEQIKKIELDILLEFKKICESNSLRYSLCGGTLLGAVRHKGFIPWDDDIDVCMPRKDYERLIEIVGEDIFSKHYRLISSRFGSFYFPYLKIIDINTHMKQKYFQQTEFDALWIDIFPVDGLPDKESEIKKILTQMRVLRKILSLNCVNGIKSKNLLRTFSRCISVPFSKCIGVKRCNLWMERLAQGYSSEQAPKAGIVVWGLYGYSECLSKDVFVPNEEAEFEGHIFTIMCGWHDYLSSLYGNYMELPPLEKRVTHGIEGWID